ncbi:ATP-binding cassette domain-containing protein [Pajaroellobacter abortibovis]|uniref:ABC transporter ATP-binding protein n=1 Tax=Pajaroellobacter abortibovis TaxID=1882918 RepID=A0A1L6MW06_9BACT|nr:ABC transporter ATP-binding protein [Pajaroellobacter abortibovis]APR99605.1 hypothetical protein BCY86_02105 [Pajaroellobacter abortibovis]
MIKKIKDLIIQNRKDKINIFVVLVASIFVSFLEILGFLCISFFIQSIEGGVKKGKDFFRFSQIFCFFQFDSFYVSGCFVIFLYVIRYISVNFLNRYFFDFIYSRQEIVSRNFVERIFYRKYPYYQHIDSSEAINIVSSQIPDFVHYVVVRIYLIFLEIISSVPVLVLVLMQAPKAVFVVGVLSGTLFLMGYRSIRKRIVPLGRRERVSLEQMVRYLQQGLGMLKEARLAGRESFFLESYEESNRVFCDSRSLYMTLASRIRFLFETLGVIGLVCIGFWIFFYNKNYYYTSTTLGILATGIVRLVPAISRVLACSLEIRHYINNVEILWQMIVGSNRLEQNMPAQQICSTLQKPFQEAPPSFIQEVRMIDVEHNYSSSLKPALHSVACSFKKGECVGIIGPSGSGKSTFLDIFMGLMKPSAGVLEVDGQKLISPHDVQRWQRRIAYVPQDVFLWDDSVLHNITFDNEKNGYDHARLAQVIEQAQLASVIKELPQGIHTWVGERGIRLSGGQRQRIGIARALYRSAEVFVFDEATSAIDINLERSLVEVIHSIKPNRLILIVAHRLAAVRKCDRILFIKGGRIEDKVDTDYIVEKQGCLELSSR